MVKYKGKKRLYKFLKTHGYDVPKMKDMEYSFYRGFEWLKSFEVKVYSCSSRISVYTYEFDEDGQGREKDYVVYKNGEVFYKTLYGKCVD